MNNKNAVSIIIRLKINLINNVKNNNILLIKNEFN